MKIKSTSITYIIATALSIASLICITISNSIEGYSLTNPALAFSSAIISILLCVAGFIVNLRSDINEIVRGCIGLLAICLLSVYFGSIILQRSELVASQFTYDRVNTLGWQALIPSLVSIGLSLLAAISITIGAFLKDK